MSLRRVEYEDFWLVAEGAGGEYRASVVESPAGESAAPEVVRWSALAERPAKEDDLRRAGAALFDAFVSGQALELYRASIAHALERRRGLRLKLTIGPRELVHAPWELLYDTRNRCYVGLSSRSPIVRHPRVPQPMETLTVEPPLRILGMVANPRAPNLPRLNVARERKLIDKALAQAVKHGLVEIRWLDGATHEALRKAMPEGWHVFHFCGHGDYDAQSGEGYLVLEDEEGGPDRLRAADLGTLLREEGGVRLAVLNCCKGAAADTRESSSSCADALVRAGMGGVVAMQNPISDRAATTFARVAYLAIASRLPLDAAVGSARVAMKLAPTGPIEWWTPVLHLRAKSGALFELPEAPAAERLRIKGIEYLGPELDRRMEEALTRRKRLGRAIGAWVVAPIPLLAFLIATPVSSDVVRADVEASAVSFTLASEREVFSELPRLASFSASGFRQVLLPGSAFPVRPDSAREAKVRAVAADDQSWISLQPWLLPAGSRVTLDHPRGAASGEYALSLVTGADQRFNLGLVRRIRLSRFGAPLDLYDFADTASVQLVTGTGSLDLELRVADPSSLTLPPLTIDSLELLRQGYSDTGPLAESTVLRARVRFDRRDTVLDAVPLGLRGLRQATMERIRLTDRGIAFTVTGPVERITLQRKPLAFPTRLQWLMRERPSYLWVGGLVYILVLLAGAVSWRTTHVARATEN